MTNPLDQLALLKRSSVKPTETITQDIVSLSLDDFALVKRETSPAFSLDMGDFNAQLPAMNAPPVAQSETGERIVLETNTKDTLTRMIQTTKMNEPFVFFVRLNKGDHYVNAMRVLLSRVKSRLRGTGKSYSEFKLNVRAKQHNAKGGYDKITVVRTKPGAGSREFNSYKELENMLEINL